MSGTQTPDDILYAFAVEPDHGPGTLRSYMERHPELAHELLDLAHELRLVQVDLEAPDPTPDDPAKADAAWERFMACSPGQQGTEEVFTRLQGKALAKLAADLEVPRTILAAVRDRLVAPSTYPRHFLRQLAEKMGVALAALHGYVRMPPAVPAQAAFKAASKPSAQQQVSFAQLVADTEMPVARKEALLHDPA